MVKTSRRRRRSPSIASLQVVFTGDSSLTLVDFDALAPMGSGDVDVVLGDGALRPDRLDSRLNQPRKEQINEKYSHRVDSSRRCRSVHARHRDSLRNFRAST